MSYCEQKLCKHGRFFRSDFLRRFFVKVRIVSVSKTIKNGGFPRASSYLNNNKLSIFSSMNHVFYAHLKSLEYESLSHT